MDPQPQPTPEPEVNLKDESTVKEESGPVRKDPGIEYKYNTEYHRFCDDLGIDKYKRESENIAQKVALLYDWTKEQIGSEDGVKITDTVKDLIRTLGVQNIQGELLVDYLYRWCRIDMDSERIRVKAKEKEMIEKSLSMKTEIKKIEPKISEEELEKRIKEGMKDMQAEIKRKVKSRITNAINKGIKEAIQKVQM